MHPERQLTAGTNSSVGRRRIPLDGRPPSFMTVVTTANPFDGVSTFDPS